MGRHVLVWVSPIGLGTYLLESKNSHAFDILVQQNYRLDDGEPIESTGKNEVVGEFAAASDHSRRRARVWLVAQLTQRETP